MGNKNFSGSKLTIYARKMRKEPTKAEAVVWSWIRRRQINNLRFRRQYRIENYILDFYCPEIKLAIEVDGITHDNDQVYENDQRRQDILKSRGVKILRISDEEVLQRKVDVASWILGFMKHNY